MLFFHKAKKDDRAAGEELFLKGQWPQALASYEKVLVKDAENVQLLRRVADLRARVGQKSRAVDAYRKVAELYAGSGFLVQAIAIHKILLRLDPSAGDVGHKLADLYAQRGIPAQGTAEVRKGLPAIPLFSDLDPESFRQVLDHLVPRSLAMGETLFRQGEPGDSIFVVSSGSVRVSREGRVLAELGEGEFFGEAAFFSHEPRNADVSAVAPAELLEMRREDLEPLMARYPGVSNALGVFYRRRILDGVLAGSPLFGSLPETERKRIADLFELVRIAAGETVLREGDTDRALYLVKRGRLSVTTVSPANGGPLRLAELGPGQVFGEVSLVARAPRTATVTALEAGEVLRAEGSALDPFLEAHPSLREALELLLRERAEDTVAKVLGRGA
ncbi:MAG: cyclic nucleotide-binding domain-containing protein [Deltaproteobacteria bacterium]|nr:cyclic nucleotide-binding domain-containing protein [Deltaproteobacteria bacterium]